MTEYKTASHYRGRILDLAEDHGCANVLHELVLQLSGDEARDFIDHFRRHWEVNTND
nr:hypothetical protein 20 [bacterium]